MFAIAPTFFWAKIVNSQKWVWLGVVQALGVVLATWNLQQTKCLSTIYIWGVRNERFMIKKANLNIVPV